MDRKISPHFKLSEFKCKCGCGFSEISTQLVSELEELCEHFEQPIIINCGCRCSVHNKAVKGAYGSQHLIGMAADIVVKNKTPVLVADYLEHKYPDSHGIGRYSTFTHFDVRPAKARWHG